MSTYPESTSIKTNDYELKNIKEKLKEIERQKKFDNEYIHFAIILDDIRKDKIRYKKKASKNHKQQIFNKIVGILSGVSTLTGAILSSTVLASIAGIPLSTASFVLTIASMIMHAYLDSVKIRNRKIRDFINLTVLLYEKTMKKALQDNTINEQEQRELKDIYQHYLNKKDDVKKSTQFDVKEVFKDSLVEMAKRDLIKDEIIVKLNDFSNKTSKSKMKEKTFTFNVNININFNKNKKEKIEQYEPSAPPYYE